MRSGDNILERILINLKALGFHFFPATEASRQISSERSMASI